MMEVRLSSLLNVYTDFALNYSYNYATGEYADRIVHNKKGGDLTSTYTTLCSDAEDNYLFNRKLEYNTNWIYDDTTAQYLLQKLISWHTKQRLIVEYWGDVKNHIKYELGDKVKINYSDMLPTGISSLA